jgi:uncharacterized protein involved in exopolysaccharide biosynthesis
LTVPRQRQPEAAAVPISRETPIPNPARAGGGITVVDIFSVLLRYRVMIVVIALLLALKTGIDVIKLPRFYSTEAEFMPQGARGQSQLLGLARQFGISIGSDAGDTPQFYMDLITSRLILGEVAKKQYEMKTDSGVSSGTLIKLLGGGKLPLRAQGPYIVGRMKRLVDVQVSPKTGVITLTVRAFTPDMAVQIANNVLSEVNTFNLNRRQQAAAGEREFVENREAEALSDLRNAEENLQSFLVQNRDFTVSPTLQLEHSRLTRAVDMRQTLYTSLATAAEQAKIEEVRNLPVITVLAPPEAPLIPESKRGMRKVLFSLIIGAVIGAMIAFAMAGLAASTRGHPNDIAEFDRLKGETIDDIKHPWRPLVRMFSWRRRPATPV